MRSINRNQQLKRSKGRIDSEIIVIFKEQFFSFVIILNHIQVDITSQSFFFSLLFSISFLQHFLDMWRKQWPWHSEIRQVKGNLFHNGNW